MLLNDLYKQNIIGINFFRYLLAMLVIFDHSYHMAGFGEEPILNTFGEKTALGFIAVGAFFAISGYLITNSAINSNPTNFLLNRFLRIFPAYTFLLFFTAFILTPILLIKSNELNSYFLNFQSDGPYTYIFHNIFLPVELQNTLVNLFINSPNGANVNGSLWTLPLEVRAYAICFFLVLIGKKFNILYLFIAFQFYLSICIIGDYFGNRFIYYVYPDFIHLSAKFMFIFFFSSIVAIYFNKRKISHLHFYILILTFFICYLIGGQLFQTIGISLLVFLTPYFIHYLKLSKIKFFKNDISYGTYIYGYLVGQTLVYLFDFNSHKLFFLSTVLTTTIFALFSWYFIEKPSLKLKARV